LVEAAATHQTCILEVRAAIFEMAFLNEKQPDSNSDTATVSLLLFYVVVVVKMEATDFLATMMQNRVFLGETANSHCN
jgi:hypothetical protein